MPDFPIVDCHVHLYDVTRLSYPWLRKVPQIARTWLPADFTHACGPVVVDKIVFAEVDVAEHQQLDEARWVAEQARTDPRIAGIIAACNLEQGAAAAGQLDQLAAIPGVTAIRRLIQNQPDPEFCLKPAFLEGLRLLPQHGLAFDVCVFHHQLPNAIRMVERCPEVTFVLDHIGKPPIKEGLLDPWRADIEELARLPNVWCKISGVVTEADHAAWTREQLRPYVDHVVACFGFDRIMYGSDWPVLELAGKIPQWVETVDWLFAGSTPEELRRLYRDNAIRCYRLEANA